MLGCGSGFSVSVAELTRPAIRAVYALTDLPAVDSRLGALDATLATFNERVSTLESQVASKATEKVAMTTQLSILDGRVKRTEGGVSFMLPTIPNLKAKPADAQAACSPILGAFPFAKARLETVDASETLL